MYQPRFHFPYLYVSLIALGLVTGACAGEQESDDTPIVALNAGSMFGGEQSGGRDVPIAGIMMVSAGMDIGGEASGVMGGEIVGTLAGMQAGMEAGMEAGVEAGMQAGIQAGMEAGEMVGGMMDLPPDPMVNTGWIGGPCTRDNDCAYEGGLCLPENGGYPRGMCTQECTRFCPDQDGLPVTFCIDGVLMGPGACVQRCDYIAFEGSGCRPGYSCATRPRTGETDVTNGVCLPTEQVGEPEPVTPPPGSSNCIQELAALGVNFDYRGDQSESAGNGLSCEIPDAVRVQSPINGVVYRYIESSSSTPLYGSCELMLAVYELSGLLREYGIREVGHIGTYNCRVISGTSTLSRHGYGDAIDLGSFFTNTGEEYNLVRDWEHNTTTFTNDAARILYEIGQQMHARRIFNIVLTPNYNAAHDNHFHVDLTPGGNYHGKMEEGLHQCGNEHAESR